MDVKQLHGQHNNKKIDTCEEVVHVSLHNSLLKGHLVVRWLEEVLEIICNLMEDEHGPPELIPDEYALAFFLNGDLECNNVPACVVFVV
jgi:hypothetical protein